MARPALHELQRLAASLDLATAHSRAGLEQDPERIAYALRIASRKSRAPEYVRHALRVLDAAPGSGTEAYMLSTAWAWMDRTDCPSYVESAVLGCYDRRLDGPIPAIAPPRA